jgi:hypothetical protein
MPCARVTRIILLGVISLCGCTPKQAAGVADCSALREMPSAPSTGMVLETTDAGLAWVALDGDVRGSGSSPLSSVALPNTGIGVVYPEQFPPLRLCGSGVTICYSTYPPTCEDAPPCFAEDSGEVSF